LDSATVSIAVQPGASNAELLARIEQLDVDPDQPARVVIDETTGIIVIGADVRIDKVAIAQGNLTIRITETPRVSQPNPLSRTGTTVAVPSTNIAVSDNTDNKLAVLAGGVSLEELVSGLNALGVGPRDMISILQAIKSAGALRAELVVQ
jgi:flagellar P-ring protein precursor FlgI